METQEPTAHATSREEDAPACDPVQKVFGTVELCERVLDSLSMKDVFLAQRVCHNFKTTISKSPTLQQKLFLRAPQAHPDVLWSYTDKYPLVASVIKSEPYTKAKVVLPSDDSTAEGWRLARLAVVTVNTLLFPCEAQDIKIAQAGRYRAAKMLNLWNLLTRGRVLQLYGEAMQQESIAQKMFLTSPPCHNIRLFWYSKGGRIQKVIGDIENKNGVTLKDVLSRLREDPYLSHRIVVYNLVVQPLDRIAVLQDEKEEMQQFLGWQAKHVNNGVNTTGLGPHEMNVIIGQDPNPRVIDMTYAAYLRHLRHGRTVDDLGMLVLEDS